MSQLVSKTIDSLLSPSLDSQHHLLGNVLLYESSVISIMVSHFDYKHRFLVEKNVPIALILPSRRQDGAESLGIEHTSCLWQNKSNFYNQAVA